MSFTARYTAYAASQSLTPDAQLSRDKALMPGACMMAFQEWISRQWCEWARETGEAPLSGAYGWSEDQHSRFDAWLSSKWDEPPVTTCSVCGRRWTRREADARWEACGKKQGYTPAGDGPDEPPYYLRIFECPCRDKGPTSLGYEVPVDEVEGGEK